MKFCKSQSFYVERIIYSFGFWIEMTKICYMLFFNLPFFYLQSLIDFNCWYIITARRPDSVSYFLHRGNKKKEVRRWSGKCWTYNFACISWSSRVRHNSFFFYDIFLSNWVTTYIIIYNLEVNLSLFTSYHS